MIFGIIRGNYISFTRLEKKLYEHGEYHRQKAGNCPQKKFYINSFRNLMKVL